ncbi:gastrokine-1-like [Ambystoma mexicanum]|uniref:gastrokine-1-like n=1 Tax=Ambystoma mexicanum TaxID=8296 RepID=UPI0037E9286B
MKTLILVTSLLGVFFSPLLADDSISITNQGNACGSVHQTVNINNQDNIANIVAHAGMSSSSSIFDWGSGFVASRILSRRACYVSRMDRATFPSLQEVQRLASTRKMKPKNSYPEVQLQYSGSPQPLVNLGQFGPHIQTLCRSVPTYMVFPARQAEFFVGGELCARAGLLGIFGISICGGFEF